MLPAATVSGAGAMLNDCVIVAALYVVLFGPAPDAADAVTLQIPAPLIFI